MKFPVLYQSQKRLPDGPQFIRWEVLNEEWAHRNHHQTLMQLAERGGLSPSEALANIEHRRWRSMDPVLAQLALKQYEA